MVLGNLFVLIGSLSAGGLLTGLGQTRIPMYQSIATIIIGIPVGFFLIPMFGVPGFILAGIVSGIPSMAWGLFWIWKHYKAKADFKSSVKILAASAIAALAAYLPTILLDTANWIKLVVALAIFLVVYVLDAPLIGAVTQADINNLRIMFSSLGFLSKIIDIPLRVAERAALIVSPEKS